MVFLPSLFSNIEIMEYVISTNLLTIDDIDSIITEHKTLKLSDECISLVNKCREYLDRKLKTRKEPVYGLNTGFGSLCDKRISNDDLSTLQTNLVMSHACGCGAEVEPEVVKIMLLLKAKSLSFGHSGVQLATVQRLIDFFNNDILPVVYKQGSLGASGDLAPLAHLSLPILGLGEVYYKGIRRDSASVLAELGWNPLTLQSKEGLALLNGTQFMQSYGVYGLIKGRKLSRLADEIACVSLEGFDGLAEPFDHLLHDIRHHNGQIETAEHISRIISDSGIVNRPKSQVQDPYSFRCIPQVHGASKDAIDYVLKIFTEEINAVTDNPTIFPDEDKILSGGNFHGQPIAIAMDFLAIALAELANISERRTYQLISGKRGLPSFLVMNPGLNSGFMIPQYAAASIVSQNKQLCTPASVDSIESSQGQEDHVSMGANAATKLFQVVNNVETVLAIELFNAAQAWDIRLHDGAKPSSFTASFMKDYRKVVPFVDNDKYMHPEIMKSVEFLRMR